jgi:prepilin-type N-terminal cleavage/methylation domain-containing protein
MNRKGFTLLELLIGVVVVCLVILIALPMYAMRSKRTEQVNVRAQLQCIREAEESYRSRHGCYTDDATKLANWKQRTKRYHFRIRHASSTRFIAEANGDLNSDRICDDTWTIDENGVLANVK